MNSHRAGIIVILFIALLGSLWAMGRFLSKSEPSNATMQTLTLTHTQRGDEQMYRGTARVVHACDQLASAISVSYSRPPTARIDLSGEKRSDIPCKSQSLAKEFLVSFISKEVPTIEVTFDGRPVPVVIVEGQ